MSLWKVAKDFRHVERIISHFEQDLRHGLEAKKAPLMEEAKRMAAVSEATNFTAMDIAEHIGEYVTAKAQEQVASGEHEPLSDARIEIRQGGGTTTRPEPNIMGPDWPLVSSGQLRDSITWGTVKGADEVEVQIGVPIDSPAADYAPLQELGGVTSSDSMIPNATVPPRPFLVPALVESIPYIESLMMKWIEYNATLAARVNP